MATAEYYVCPTNSHRVSFAVPTASIQDKYSGLQIHEYCSRDIVLVVRLVEEHVFTIAALGGPLLEYAFVVDSMLGAQTLPVHGAHWIESTL